MLNLNFFSEHQLLKRCSNDDAGAQTQFKMLSYLNQVYRTAREVNLQYNQPLSQSEVNDLCKVLTIKIYEGHEELPDPHRNLYKRIHDYVFLAVKTYIENP